MLPLASAGSATCIRGPRPSLPGVAPPARRSHRTPVHCPLIAACCARQMLPTSFSDPLIVPHTFDIHTEDGPTEFVSLRSAALWMSEFTAAVRSYGAADEGSVSPTKFCTIEIGKVPVSLFMEGEIFCLSLIHISSPRDRG